MTRSIWFGSCSVSGTAAVHSLRKQVTIRVNKV
jgi:hypothetical protein